MPPAERAAASRAERRAGRRGAPAGAPRQRRPRSHERARRGAGAGAATAAAHENEERWLLTYADMITLLMALFIVLFSISSVNISKFKSLQQSLRDAFSGRS